VDEGRKVIFLGSAADVKTPLNTTAQFSASMLTDEIDTVLEREQFDILHFHEPWVPVLSRQILKPEQHRQCGDISRHAARYQVAQTSAKYSHRITKPMLRHIDALRPYPTVRGILAGLADVPVKIIPNGWI